MSVETSEPPRNKGGRPSLYSPEMAAEICHRISTSPDGIRKICQADDMPAANTIYTWLYLYPEFQEQYARAREQQAEVFAQWMVDIATEAKPERDHIQKAKLEIDTLKWVTSKLKPKKYGDGITLRGDKENPLELGLANLLDAVTATRKAIEGEYEIMQPQAAIESKTAELTHTDLAATSEQTPVERS